MSISINKKFFLSLMKSCLQIIAYILLGLMLAFFINSTAQAAELPDEPYYNEETAVDDYDYSYSDPPPEGSLDSDADPPTQPDPTGRLLIHSRAENTNFPLSGTVFTIYRTFDNALITELTTNMFGEAMPELPAGDYYLRKTAVQSGFILNTDRINFSISANEITEVTVISKPEPVIIPPLEPLPGRLVIVNRTDSANASLSGSVFAVFNAMNDNFIAEVITNHFGEASVELPAGDYYIRQTHVPAGIILNTDRISFRIIEGEVRTVNVVNRLQAPPPTTTQPPAEQPGRLLVTVRADGTRENIQGASFTLHHSLTDEIAARLTTDRFGEASVQLPAGDYFLRQVSTPDGFILNTDRIPVRIQANAVREINVTNGIEPPLADDPPPDGTGSGRLLIFKRADGTRELLEGAVFAVHEARFDMHISTLTTNRFGEASINLPVGNYYLRQLTAPDGYILNSDRINFQITADEIREITVTSRAEPVTEVPQETEPLNGRLLITVRAENTGAVLQGVYFAVYHGMTDEIVAGRHSDQFGEISFQLPAGDYFIRQMTTPDGFIVNTDRIPVRIREGEVTDITVIRAVIPLPTPAPTPAPTQNQTAAAAPTPPVETPPSNQGRIEIITRASGSGNLLSGGIYAIYRASDSSRVGQVTTGAGGMAHLAVEPGMYFVRELRPTFGFHLETERIFLEVSARETVTMELTKNRDFNIIDLPPDSEGNAFIYITQTGQDMSVWQYSGGGLMIAIAFLLGGLALWDFLSNKKLKREAVHD